MTRFKDVDQILRQSEESRGRLDEPQTGRRHSFRSGHWPPRQTSFSTSTLFNLNPLPFLFNLNPEPSSNPNANPTPNPLPTHSSCRGKLSPQGVVPPPLVPASPGDSRLPYPPPSSTRPPPTARGGKPGNKDFDISVRTLESTIWIYCWPGFSPEPQLVALALTLTDITEGPGDNLHVVSRAFRGR